MVTLWKNDQQLCWLSGRMTSSFVDCVLWEISRHLLCRYLAERDWSYLHHQRWQRPCSPSTENLGCEQQNETHLVWLIFEVSIPTWICFPSENFLWHVGTHLMIAKSSLKACPEKTLTTACLQEGEYVSAKKLGIKTVGGYLLKRSIFFQEIMYPLCSLMWHKLWRCVTRSYIHTLYLADTLAYQLKFESF